MIKISNFIKNNKFLSLIISIYLVLMFTMPNKGIEAFNNTLYYIKEMIIIMPVILVLTSLIEAWVPKKMIQSALGENSGFKGNIFSFLLGSFSAGPIYAAFPVCITLLKKGATVANVVIILSSWAVIKIPMLANEAKFLGFKFMIIRWILTTISIFIIAYIIGKLVKKEEILSNDISEYKIKSNTLYVESDYCIGCGICEKLSPANFVMEGKKAKVINNNINDNVENTVSKCPANAIKYK